MATADNSSVTAARIQYVKNVIELWEVVKFSVPVELPAFQEFMQMRARNGGKFSASGRSLAGFRRNMANAASAASQILNDDALERLFASVGQGDRFDWRSNHKEIYDSFEILLNALGWLAMASSGKHNDQRLRLAIQVECILANLTDLRSSANSIYC